MDQISAGTVFWYHIQLKPFGRMRKSTSKEERNAHRWGIPLADRNLRATQWDSLRQVRLRLIRKYWSKLGAVTNVVDGWLQQRQTSAQSLDPWHTDWKLQNLMIPTMINRLDVQITNHVSITC